MSYAVRNDLKGWRAVDCEEDCSIDEFYQIEQPDPPIPDETVEVDPTEKLKKFLSDNPDVAKFIGVK